MKRDRLLLSMQLFATIPPLLFILIYGHTLLYAVLGVSLLVLNGVNIYRYKRQVKLLDYPLWLMLILSFLIYANFHLGSKESPQTFKRLQKNDTVMFSFHSPASIGRVCYYVGIDKSVNFTFDAKQNGHWYKAYNYDKNFPFSFRWRCFDRNITATEVRLRVTKHEMMLGEVRFFSQQGKALIPHTSVEEVFDEPEKRVDTTFFGGMFFDEIYHSRTAYELLHHLPVYETTHPYLGKYLIEPGIIWFGMTPYGWRVTNILFAAIFIVVMYYFGLLLFKRRSWAFVSAFLMTYSFMHLTQSRIGLIDTFGVLFVLTSYYFLYRFLLRQYLSNLWLSGLFFGLASAVKWSAVFAVFGFILIAIWVLIIRYPLQKRFYGYRLIIYGFFSYGLLAGSIYLLSFFDIYIQTGSISRIFQYQVHMYHYHSALVSTHPYSSSWWSWPLDYKPMCYYRQIKEGLFSSITVFGNPAIFWGGIFSLVFLVYKIVKNATLTSAFILFAFIGLYAPYIFIGRLMFIYHFYYAVPFLILAVVYTLKSLYLYKKKAYVYICAYLVTVALLFLAYYPVLSGYAVPKFYVDYFLRWFPWWWL